MTKSPRKTNWTLLLFGTAPVLTLILECLNRHSLFGGFAFAAQAPGLFLFNALLVMDTLYIALLFRRRIFAFLLVCALWLTCGITNCVMVSFRTLPFTIIDLSLLKDAIGLFDVYFNLFQRILIVGAGIAAAIAIGILFFKAPRTKRMPLHRLAGGAVMLAALSLSCLSLAMNTGAIAPSLSDLNSAYEEYGFPYCFLSTFVDVGVDKPENYTEQAIEQVEAQIEPEATDTPAYLVRPNVIFLQLESFFDPAYILDLDLKENPIPTFTRLRNAFPSGFLTVPSIGGGTANTEFEVLTGMALQHFGAGEYPYNTVMKENAVETLCYNLAEFDYSSHAIHNHAGSFYNRNLVYPNMGFDTFTSLEYMNGYTINTLGWASDDVLTGEVLKAIRSTDGRDFVFCVSVQSHGHYPTEQVFSEPAIENIPPDDASYWSLDYYVQEIALVDAFIAELTAALEESGEPTLLVMYGDHLPTLGLANEDLENGDLYQTEYIVWNNYSGLLRHMADRDLYAYQLGAYVMDLLEIRTGNVARLHQAYLTDAFPADADYMDSLQLIEYDVLYGDSSLYDGASPYVPTRMRMGVAPIGITGLNESDDALIVKGSGFTDHSEVFFDGEPVQTIFVSPGLLVACDLPEDGAPVTVQQIASDGISLSESNAMILPFEASE